MKSKKVLIGIVVAVIAVIVAAIALSNRPSSVFGVESDENGHLHVTAQNAGADASAMGYVTIEEGQMLRVRANLTDNSSISIEVFPENVIGEAVLEKTFTAIDAGQFELSAGTYAVRVTAGKGADGTMDITSE